jgi:two-component system, NtrC family, nitrogen regulation response regulator NtrX
MAKSNILIVEDEKLLNEAYELVLKNEGYDIATAFNGEDALKKTADKDFELILLDLRMPKMDGVEFLKKYNPKKHHPKTKIIIFSNYDDQDEVNQAMENGATRYILKAWSSPKELIKLVRDTLAEK